MSELNLSVNRLLNDHRQISFIVTANGQDFELAISAISVADQMTFYSIFKPVDYDHIISLSAFSPSWVKAKALFKELVLEVSNSYGISLDSYPELSTFIDKA